MIDRLPKSLEKVTFYADPRRNRDIKFLSKLIFHTVEDRDLLTNLQTIKIIVYDRIIQRCPLCFREHNDRCHFRRRMSGDRQDEHM
jgi:hypothetical protein